MVACLDRSAAKGGPLVGYRWDGEVELQYERLIAVGAELCAMPRRLEIKIPSDAIGRPGMVAVLRRVGQQDVGKVVGLMHPVGFLASPGPGSRPVYSWRVLLTGQTVDLDYRSRREIVVVDARLSPIGVVPPKALADQGQGADIARLLRGLSGSSTPPGTEADDARAT